MNLAYRGAVGPAGGWLGRAQRLLENGPDDTPEHGYLMIPLVFRHEAAGDFEAAAAVAGQAAAIGARFGDGDLFAIALHAQGHMLVRAGRVVEGLALLDEAMVAVTVSTAELSPFVVGIVYCGVILACQEVFEVRRAREWTLALTEWVDQQRDLYAFTGRCLIHRAEILQLSGSWSDALEEARRAGRRLTETMNPAAGVAHYRQAELLRLRGEFGAAEDAYREASHAGWEPQPGLAQLRLAQGKCDAAFATIRRASAEIAEPLKRAALLPAYVEIALAAGDIEEARTACGELEELAELYESAMLAAMVAYARGAVALAAGDPQAALVSLREAQQVWLGLDAPYEVARTRALVGQACSALGDRNRLHWRPRPRATSSGGSGRRPISLASRRRRHARRTACPGGSSRCCASSPRGMSNREIATSWSSASTRSRDICRTSMRSSASPRARRRPPSRSSAISSEDIAVVRNDHMPVIACW